MSHSLSQQRRAGVEAILARIAADPAFRQQIQANPSETIVSLVHVDDAPEVKGFRMACISKHTCRITRIPK